MFERVRRWLAGDTFVEHVYDGEGSFFEAGAHAEVIEAILAKLRARAEVRDRADDDGRLVIEIGDVRVTSARALDASDWCDTGTILAALNHAADRAAWAWRFTCLPTADQCERLAAIPIEVLRRRRWELALELPSREVAEVRAGALVVPDGRTVDRAGALAFVEPALALEARTIDLAAPARVDGVLVRARARLDQRGRLAAGTLVEDTRLGPCVAKAGTEIELGFGLPESITLAAPWTLSSVELPAGTHVDFWSHSIDHLETIPCHAVLPTGEELDFSESGDLLRA